MKIVRRAMIVFMILLVISGVYAQEEGGELMIDGAEVIATGFNLPQGVMVDPLGSVWVIDSGVGGEDEILFFAPGAEEPAPSPFGMSARVVGILVEDGQQVDAGFLPSVVAGQEIIGGARLALINGELYATSGQWIEFNGPDRQEMMGAVVNVDFMGTVTEVASTWAIEDAENPDGTLKDSHPYGIAASPDGMLYVADAGANSLLKVDPESGEVEVVAAFEGIPGPFPNEARGGAMEMDPVPTGVAVDADGNVYVALLTGFPFLPGSAKVLAVAEDGTVSDYATGLTMLTDLQVAPDGMMYAVQIAVFGEEGPVPNSGAIIRIMEGDASEVVFTGLPNPTAISFDADGNAYVTVNGGFGPPGIGAVIKIADLVNMMGSPVTEMMG